MCRKSATRPLAFSLFKSWSTTLAAAALALCSYSARADEAEPPVRIQPAMGGAIRVHGETEHPARIAPPAIASFDVWHEPGPAVQLWPAPRMSRESPVIALDSELPTLVLRCRDDRESGGAKVRCDNADLPISFPHSLPLCHEPKRTRATAAELKSFAQHIRSGKPADANVLPVPWIAVIERRAYTSQRHKVGQVRSRMVTDRVLEHHTALATWIPSTSPTQVQFRLIRPLDDTGAMPASLAEILMPKGGPYSNVHLHHLHYRSRALDTLDMRNLSPDLRVALSYNRAAAAIAIGHRVSAVAAIDALHRDLSKASPALRNEVSPLLGPLDQIRSGELLVQDPCHSVFSL